MVASGLAWAGTPKTADHIWILPGWEAGARGTSTLHLSLPSQGRSQGSEFPLLQLAKQTSKHTPGKVQASARMRAWWRNIRTYRTCFKTQAVGESYSPLGCHQVTQLWNFGGGTRLVSFRILTSKTDFLERPQDQGKVVGHPAELA